MKREMDHYQLLDWAIKLIMENVSIVRREEFLNQVDRQRCLDCKRIMEFSTNGKTCQRCEMEKSRG